MSDLRILIATQNLKIVGGTEKYLQSIIPTLVQRGHEISLLHADAPISPEETVDPGDQCTKWSLFGQEMGSLLKLVAAWMPDVVYCHGLRSDVLESLLISNYPSVLYAHNYYGTCGTGTKLHSFPVIQPCVRKFGPTCLLLHYPRRCGGLSPLTAFSHYRLQNRRSEFLRSYGAVIVASTHMFREISKHGVSSSRLHLVPPIAEFVPQMEAPSFRVPQGRILYIGRLTNGKGLHYLMSAIPTAQSMLDFEIRLTVAGTGPEERQFRELRHRSQIRVEFIGWANRESRQRLLSNTDLLAIPSLWPEPFGLVGVEAACFGIPSVGYEVGGIPDWLESGKTGELAPGDPPTVDGLAAALVRVLKDPTHYDRLCKGAWQKAQEMHRHAHVPRLESILSYAAKTATPLTN